MTPITRRMTTRERVEVYVQELAQLAGNLTADERVELATELRRYLDSLTGAPIQRRVLLNLANSLEAGGDA